MMAVQSRTYKPYSINKVFNQYLFFLHYYQEQLLSLDLTEVQEVVDVLFAGDRVNEETEKGLATLLKSTVEDYQEAIFDFNKLFIGPAHLLAPPFESVYTSEDRVLMQQRTMNVRNFYLAAGIKVAEQGQVPDDYIGYELEFICHLLAKLAEEESEQDTELLQLFLDHHIKKWIPQHCDDVITNCDTDFCKGIAYLLKGLVEETFQITELVREG